MRVNGIASPPGATLGARAPGKPPMDKVRAGPAHATGVMAWLRKNLFDSWLSTATTLVFGAIALLGLLRFLDWGLVHAVWHVPEGSNGPDTSACQAVKGVGACWAVIGEKWRFILFARYPYESQWRPAFVVLLFIGLFVTSGFRRCWRIELLAIWIVTLAVIATLMWGGILGLPFVPVDEWGGLPLTLILATFGLAFGFPLAVFVALGRRSEGMPVVRLMCIAFVEVIRGVPLITLLFMASVMFPLFMPDGLNPDKLLRAQAAIVLFAAAYLAEDIRAGLQALPRGQHEAAEALGLTYVHKMLLIILPQALRLVIPPLVSNFIGFFKDTSLVLIIGLFDLLAAGKIAISEPVWASYSTEVYLALAFIYFIFCFAMARYSQRLEVDLARSARY